MTALIITVVLTMLVSASCSLSEAVLYSVPLSHVENLRKSGHPAGKILHDLRMHVERPITAVLTLNTIANTAGAVIAGALAGATLGHGSMFWFAAVFTLLLLLFSEILPKTLGIAYNCRLAGIIAGPLKLLVFLLTPAIAAGAWFTRLFTPHKTAPRVTEDDIRAIVSLSRQSGRIEAYEEHSIRNILSLDQKAVSEIMTPRIVVFSLSADKTVAEAYATPDILHHSRIPVYGENNEDIIGIVTRRRILLAAAADTMDVRMNELMQPVRFVLETQTLDTVLRQFLDARMHLFVVLDEYGGLSGVVSLEDVLEEILGSEIVDETDEVADLRALAKSRRAELAQRQPGGL